MGRIFDRDKDKDQDKVELKCFEVQYKIDDVGYHCTEEAVSKDEAEAQVLVRLNESYPLSVCSII
jgi:hypothetical protein